MVALEQDGHTLYQLNAYTSTPSALTSISRCGASATPSTHSFAPGTVCTSRAIAAISCIFPNTLLACVQHTNLVFSESSGRRFKGVSVGFVSAGEREGWEEGSLGHHLTV